MSTFKFIILALSLFGVVSAIVLCICCVAIDPMEEDTDYL